MKLRTQFYLLIGGIIAVPLLVSVFALVMQWAVERGHEPLPNYASFNTWVRERVPRALASGNIEEVAEERPRGLDFAVVDSAWEVTFSTIGSIRSSATAEGRGDELLAYMRDNLSRYHFQLEPVTGVVPQDSLVILQVPRLRPGIAEARTSLLKIVTYGSIALLVFSSVMALLILRSLERSIKHLEAATRRISEGDLDFELPAMGNDQIASLTRSFDRMRSALREEYARRARFIMGVSHDLRTPLTLIQGYVEAIEDGLATDPEAQKKYLAIILDKTRNLDGMVGELIEFVRMETGQWRMTHRPVAASAFMADAAQRFGEDALLLKREFTFSNHLDADAVVRMDERLFARALENLVGNAIRYTDVDGTVTLTAQREANEVVISVGDTGMGIPHEDLSRIYEPFYRGSNSRREQGAGLGLTTVKWIVESHGWTIAVDSAPGTGTTFTIRIPVEPSGTSTPSARA